MKLLLAGIILAFSWEPSCSPESNPTRSGSDYNNDRNDDPVYSSVFEGRALDYATGDYVDSAEFCAHWVGLKSCQSTGQVCKNAYRFNLRSITAPYDVKIKVTHPDYESDSLLDIGRGGEGTFVTSVSRRSRVMRDWENSYRDQEWIKAKP